MKIIPPALLVALAVLFGLFRSRSESAESWSDASTALLAVVMVMWFPLSRILLRFIDARNHSHKVAGLAGFLVLLLSVFAVEWLAFSLKSRFAPAPDLSASFLDDVAWLILFPLLFYQMTTAKKAKPPDPTPAGVTPPADASGAGHL